MSSTTETQPLDAGARHRIRHDLETTFVVEAAAGTGKTTELVGRMVAALRTGVTSLDRMIAVTFTDKAAGEMKLRLRTEIDHARRGSQARRGRRAGRARAVDLNERDRLDRALSQLEVARIGTIHSFCSDLLRERPIEAGIDPAFAVLPDDEGDALIEWAFERWFQRALEDPPEGLRRILRWRPWRRDSGPRETLLGACRQLVEHRDHDAPWRRDSFDRAMAMESLISQVLELGALWERARDPQDYLARSLRPIADLARRIRDRAAAGDRDRDDDALEAELRSLRKQVKWHWKGRGSYFADGVSRGDVMDRRGAFNVALEAFLAGAEADLAACLQAELRPVVAAYEELKARGGSLDFLDLLIGARTLLRANAGVRAELQQRFTHLFVDEFQDTDPLQAEILMLLASEDPAITDLDEITPVPGKLFVVGDPKQSIYRFRRADVALYERVKRLLVARGAEVLQLSTSFRSVPSIQQLVNASFAPLMQGAVDGSQADYVALQPHRSEATDHPAVVALPAPAPHSPWGKITKWAVGDSLPDAVGAFVQWLVYESGWRVREPGGEGTVPVTARHVCLLFRRFAAFGDDVTRGYVRALEARRIPHVLVGGRSFHEREEVMAMVAALEAIEHPDDELHVFATLRGPFFALRDDWLLTWRDRVGSFHPLRPLTDEQRGQVNEEVVACMELLRALHLKRNRRPIADTIARLLEATRAHAGIAILPTGEQALANVLRVMDQARSFEARGTTSFRAFVRWLGRQAERGQAAQAPVVEEGTDGVRIMTVHKAKGLEFPVVILCDPGCSRTPSRPSRYVDPVAGLWAAPLAGCVPAELRDHTEAVLRADAAEEIRIAYVATTRARDLLVVPVTGEGRVDGWVDVLHPVVYPPEDRQREPESSLESGAAAPGCPAFGDDSLAERNDRVSPYPDRAVAPGLHRSEHGLDLVWWDPNVLNLGVRSVGGVRQQEILAVDEGEERAEASIADYQAWVARRSAVVAAGSSPTVIAKPVTQLAHARAEAMDAAAHDEATDEGRVVRVAETPHRSPTRPHGKRFGTLVHAVLEQVALDADAAGIRPLAVLHGRLVGATDEEVDAAVDAVVAALAHDMLRRGAAVQSQGACHREAPVVLRLQDGSLAEGIIDLVFREETTEGPLWIVVDFKTDADLAGKTAYVEQVRLYVEAMEAATGEPAEGWLLGV